MTATDPDLTDPGRNEADRGEAAQNELLRIYLRGGQVIEKRVTWWKIRRDVPTGDLVELLWRTNGSGELLPYARLDAVDAVTVHPLPDSASSTEGGGSGG